MLMAVAWLGVPWLCLGSVAAGASRVAVVGAGVGGLVAAARLAQQGHDVTLLEKNHRLGGRMQSEHLGEYRYCMFMTQIVSLPQMTPSYPRLSRRFDIGPSLLLLPQTYRETFRLLGHELDEHVELARVEPFYRCFFEDTMTWVDITNNEGIMKAQVNRIEPNAWENYQRYMNLASAFLNFGLPNVIEEKLDLTHFFSFVKACLQAFPLLSHSTVLQSLFKSPQLQAILSFQDLYIGLAPNEAPAVFSLLQALEFEQGIFYPIGGFSRVASALERIAMESGVKIMREKEVKELKSRRNSDEIESLITTDANGNHEVVMDTDIVIINQDAPAAESALIPLGHRSDRLMEGGRPSCGVISLSFGFDTPLSPLQHHNIFFSANYEQSWDAVRNPDNGVFSPSAFNFYVHCPSRTDRSCCPPRHEAITVLVPVPPLARNGTMRLDVEAVRKAVLSRMQSIPGMPDSLDSHIVVEKIRTPREWSGEFGLFRGSAFGLAHSLSQLSVLRPGLRHPSLSNVYRVGASIRPGNGVPLVMISARLVTDAILNLR